MREHDSDVYVFHPLLLRVFVAVIVCVCVCERQGGSGRSKLTALEWATKNRKNSCATLLSAAASELAYKADPTAWLKANPDALIKECKASGYKIATINAMIARGIDLKYQVRNECVLGVGDDWSGAYIYQ